MESALYKSIFEKGEARGEARSEARTILRLLGHRLGAVDPDVEARLREPPNAETLHIWYEEATMIVDAEAAQKLAEKIRNAPPAR